MKIKKIRIQNFRSFVDQEFTLNRYTCFVGPNGAGKSTVLCALNVFFKEQDSSATDTSKLCDEDFYARTTNKPICITVTFDELSEKALNELSDYVRQSELVVSAEAHFDADTGIAQVRHYGQRLGIEAFRTYFEALKRNARAEELTSIYAEFQKAYPDLPAGKSKDAKSGNLLQYESEHPEQCTLIPSEDNFYGISGAGKLARVSVKTV